LHSGDKKIARSGLYQNFQMPKVEVGQKNLSKHGWIDRSNQQISCPWSCYSLPIKSAKHLLVLPHTSVESKYYRHLWNRSKKSKFEVEKSNFCKIMKSLEKNCFTISSNTCGRYYKTFYCRN